MNLPKPEISREKAMQLWISEHSDYAKEQLVLNNAGMVGDILKSLNLNLLDEDLYSTGMIGVIKAVNTFRPDKGVKFSSYATPIIRNEILMTLRKKRIIPIFSLDEMYALENGDRVLFSDMIADQRAFDEEIIDSIQFGEIMRFLSERERKIVCLQIDGKTQCEIAEMCGISQAQVSKIIKKALNKCRRKFLKG